MPILTFAFPAPIPVGHRVRTYRSNKYSEESSGWFPAGVVDVVYDLDSGIAFGSASVIKKCKQQPGEPAPQDPNERWTALFEGTVAWTHVGTKAGEWGELTTELGTEPAQGSPFR